MFSVPKIFYGIIIAAGVIAALIFWPFALMIVYSCFPILVLLMLWDIMSGMNKIWAKLWDLDERLRNTETPPVSA